MESAAAIKPNKSGAKKKGGSPSRCKVSRWHCIGVASITQTPSGLSIESQQHVI